MDKTEQQKRWEEWYAGVMELTLSKIRFLPEEHKAEIQKALAEQPPRP